MVTNFEKQTIDSVIPSAGIAAAGGGIMDAQTAISTGLATVRRSPHHMAWESRGTAGPGSLPVSR